MMLLYSQSNLKVSKKIEYGANANRRLADEGLDPPSLSFIDDEGPPEPESIQPPRNSCPIDTSPS